MTRARALPFHRLFQWWSCAWPVDAFRRPRVLFVLYAWAYHRLLELANWEYRALARKHRCEGGRYAR